jgi:Tfp pilus assembly protein PilF
MRRYLAISILFAVVLAGCASPQAASDAQTYQTISRDPRRNTEAARANNERALTLITEGKWPDAESAAQQALAEDIFFGPAHNSLGLIYFHEKKLYLSAWEFQYATKLMPNQPEPRNNLGLVLEASNKLDQAVDNYEQAMQMEPNQPQYVGNLARAQWSRGDRSPQELDLLKKVIANDDRPEWVDWARESVALMHDTRH